MISSIDGNIENQDTLPVTGNKIKINITKVVKPAVNINNDSTRTEVENNLNNLISNSQNNVTDNKEMDVEDIEYEVKPNLKNISFTKGPAVKNGFETSGLCSIM